MTRAITCDAQDCRRTRTGCEPGWLSFLVAVPLDRAADLVSVVRDRWPLRMSSGPGLQFKQSTPDHGQAVLELHGCPEHRGRVGARAKSLGDAVKALNPEAA